MEGRLARAKVMARPELSDPEAWRRRGWAESLRLDPGEVVDGLERVDCRGLSVEQFWEEHGDRPMVLTHVADGWPASTEWDPERLHGRCGGGEWKVGFHDGKPVKLPLDQFFEYCGKDAVEDDSPLYVFDWDFAEGTPEMRALLLDYQVPEYFREDLFELLSHMNSRPPHRWIIIGPARSGSMLHTDPIHTSAWNTLLSGTKRWCIFPPGAEDDTDLLPKDLLPDSKDVGGAAQWFANVLPTLPSNSGGRVEAIQKPGETVYVPAGWWHAVLNLDTTVAVTQNFADPQNFASVWREMARGRGDLISEFYKMLCRHRPELAKEADGMGGVDGVRSDLIESEKVEDLFSSLLEWPGDLSDDSDD
eukprot:TRINITY_DN59909_c0_g1_i1.p1 TRINITY_DN59909_c0_g1~~TRINITY_DN59909_c0_g1_i1.p1  ORF type:complete len:362 (-),score=68.00 TRINITY_DN59909_c0_g1_i1:171-1256(-)